MNRIFQYLLDNKKLLYLCIILGLLLKIVFFPIRLGDYNFYLEPWVDFIKENGYFNALRYEFYNYTPSYIYILVLIALTNLYPLYLIKIVSIVFEYVIAYFIGKIIFLKWKNKNVILFSLAFLPLIPTVLLNGAYWGQCDSIYSAFVISSVYYLLRKKPLASIVLLGCAFCFKMQSVFILPFYFVLMLRGDIKWYYFLLIPTVYLVSVIPTWMLGRNIIDLLTIYVEQSDYDKALAVFFPNIYIWFSDENFYLIKYLGYGFTLILTLIVGFILRNKRYKFTFDSKIYLLYLCVIITPFVLPGMRERYLYLADVTSFLYIFLIRKNLFVPVGMVLVSFYSYLCCSRFQTILSLEPAFFIYLLLIIIAVYNYSKLMNIKTDTTMLLETSKNSDIKNCN